MLDKIYLEITNVCNLDCTFCHKTARAKKLMSAQEFDLLIDKLAGKAKYLYFHLMGEPTLHPLLPRFIEAARGRILLPNVRIRQPIFKVIRHIRRFTVKL